MGIVRGIVRSAFPLLSVLLLTGCPFKDATGPGGSFSIQVTGAVQIAQGHAGNIDIEILGAGGFQGNVTISLAGHGGMTPAYSNFAPPRVGQRITLIAPSNAPPGEFPVTITAHADGHPAQTATVKITIVSTVAQVIVTPPLPKVAYDASIEVEAHALGGAGEAINLAGKTIQWRAFTAGHFNVAGTGERATLTGIGEGSTFVIARIDGVEGAQLVTVESAPVATVVVSASAASVPVGSTVRVSATAKNSRGGDLTQRRITWSSSDESIATVREDGMFGTAVVTGLRPGTVTITAESEGTRGTIVITVGTGITTLTSGVTLAGRSGAKDSRTFYQILVPVGAGRLTVTTSGGPGDADLSVGRGATPETMTPVCRSRGSTNNETCVVDSPAAGTWYIEVVGFAAYSGMSITATVGSGGTPPPSTGQVIFWTANAGVVPVTVSAGGQASTITTPFSSSQTCGTSGGATLTLPSGQHSFTASGSGGVTWRGDVTVEADRCLRMQLTYDGGTPPPTPPPPPTPGQCDRPNLVLIVWRDQQICLSRQVPGFNIAGTYTTEGSGPRYRTQLNADGSGWSENDEMWNLASPRSPAQEPTTQFQWGIRVQMNGEPMKETGTAGERHQLFIKPASRDWNHNTYPLDIVYTNQHIVIWGVRFKR
jgi:hypothetical protein